MLLPFVTPVTFASGESQVVASEAAKALGWSYSYDRVTELAVVGGHAVDPGLPRLWDGSYLLPLRTLVAWGARREGNSFVSGKRGFRLQLGAKRVEVRLGGQSMSAYEGRREVIRCAVSTGRPGKETPIGKFRLGLKDAKHVSSIYGTPMPWSVHVVGGIYVHGSEWFSGAPASHGCIRLDMHGGTNWAQWFYNWAELGTPIAITTK